MILNKLKSQREKKEKSILDITEKRYTCCYYKYGSKFFIAINKFG